MIILFSPPYWSVESTKVSGLAIRNALQGNYACATLIDAIAAATCFV